MTSGEQESAAGLKAVATFEAAKGALALLVASGLLTLWHADAHAVGETLARHLHLNPAKESGALWGALQGAEAHLGWLALGVVAYAAVRFIEAFGLWHGRAWAEWFGVVSGAIYVPFDLLELVRRPGFLSLAMLAINLLIVAYLARNLWPNRTSG